jgi:biotin operon repressor
MSGWDPCLSYDQFTTDPSPSRKRKSRGWDASDSLRADPSGQSLRNDFADADASHRGLAFRKGVSARALMAKQFEPIKWVIPGVLTEGMYILGGAPKVGKSWLALDWIFAVGSGGLAMGSISCVAGDVLGLMLEDNERRLQRRIRQMRLADVSDRVTLVTEWPTIDDGCIEEIERWISEAENPRLIVVDVFARVKGTKGSKETDYDFDYRQAAALQAISSQHNLAIAVVHHTRKMAADDPFDEVSGTRGLTGAADGVLVLKKDGGTQQPILYGRGRDLEEFESALQFEGETGTWSVLGAAWQVADTKERREIQEVLGRSVDPMSPTEIGERLGKSRQNISKMLAKMLDEGQVEKASTGRYVLVSPVSPFAPFTETRETRETRPTTREDDESDLDARPGFWIGGGRA